MDALIAGVASRPEVAGIVLLGGSMAAVVMRKARRGRGAPTPAFDRAQNAQLLGIAGLILILLVREVGKVAIILFN